jgi:hypothetical protein
VLSRSAKRRGGWWASLRSTHPTNYELSMIIPFLQVDARLVAVSARADDGASSGTRHTLQPRDCRQAGVQYWTNARRTLPRVQNSPACGLVGRGIRRPHLCRMPFPHGQIGPGICALGLKKRLDFSKPEFGPAVHYPARDRFSAGLGSDAPLRELSRHPGGTFDRLGGTRLRIVKWGTGGSTCGGAGAVSRLSLGARDDAGPWEWGLKRSLREWGSYFRRVPF